MRLLFSIKNAANLGFGGGGGGGGVLQKRLGGIQPMPLISDST